jgi:hypothetical protein
MVKVNDQIVEVDGRSLHGYTNQEAVEMLRSTGNIVRYRYPYHRHTQSSSRCQLSFLFLGFPLSHLIDIFLLNAVQPRSIKFVHQRDWVTRWIRTLMAGMDR